MLRNAFGPKRTRAISGQIISIGEDRNIVIWDAATGERTHTITLPEFILGDVTSGCGVHCQLTCCRDGSKFAACSGYRVFFWSIHEDGSLHLQNTCMTAPRGVVHALCLNRKGDRLAAGVNYALQSMMYYWDTETGNELWSCEPHNETMIMDIDISHDDTLLVSAGFYDFLVVVRSTATGEELCRLSGHSKPLSSVKFNHDDSKIASCGNDGDVFIWDVASSALSKSIKKTGFTVLFCLDFSPDGSHIAVGNYFGDVFVFDTETGRHHLKIKCRRLDGVNSISFNNDGTTIVSGTREGRIKVWDSRNGIELLTLNGHPGGVDVACFLPPWSCTDDEYLLK